MLALVVHCNLSTRVYMDGLLHVWPYIYITVHIYSTRFTCGLAAVIVVLRLGCGLDNWRSYSSPCDISMLLTHSVDAWLSLVQQFFAFHVLAPFSAIVLRTLICIASVHRFVGLHSICSYCQLFRQYSLCLRLIVFNALPMYAFARLRYNDICAA